MGQKRVGTSGERGADLAARIVEDPAIVDAGVPGETSRGHRPARQRARCGDRRGARRRSRGGRGVPRCTWIRFGARPRAEDSVLAASSCCGRRGRGRHVRWVRCGSGRQRQVARPPAATGPREPRPRRHRRAGRQRDDVDDDGARQGCDDLVARPGNRSDRRRQGPCDLHRSERRPVPSGIAHDDGGRQAVDERSGRDPPSHPRQAGHTGQAGDPGKPGDTSDPCDASDAGEAGDPGEADTTLGGSSRGHPVPRLGKSAFEPEQLAPAVVAEPRRGGRRRTADGRVVPTRGPRANVPNGCRPTSGLRAEPSGVS